MSKTSHANEQFGHVGSYASARIRGGLSSGIYFITIAMSAITLCQLSARLKLACVEFAFVELM